ncbi:MAG: hypothetical protein Q7S92_02060 [Candidatus Diapherotrites archaeon]|nr:hypothetical protein [Candidatus Diapherotrites archaeon]
MPESLEQRVTRIEERNSKVETDKSWETSWFRRILIAVVTYILIAWLFLTLQVPNSFENALIGTIAFLISTLSLPFIKQFWIQHFYKKK